MQVVPSLTGVMTHLPVAQDVERQGLVVLHTEQAPPALPHELMLVPVLQVVPLQQPLQHLPLLQVPPVQALPAAAGVVVHLLLLHRSVMHVFPEAQIAHLAPAVPHAVMTPPVWQVVPSQQPLQHFPL